MQVHLTLSRASAMVQVELRVLTPFVGRSQASCEFLARLQVCSGLAISTCLVHRLDRTLALPGARDHLAAARQFACFAVSLTPSLSPPV